LAPLTVLIGENSSGKSSLLQALLLLKQTLEGVPGEGILNLNSHYVQFQQFREVIFGVPTDSAEIYLSLDMEFEDFQIGFAIREDEMGELEGVFTYQINGEPARTYGPYEEDLIPDEFLFDFNDQYKVIRRFFDDIGYIQPIRPAPERYYDLRGIKPSWIGIRAETIADFLDANPTIRNKVREWFVETVKLAQNVKFERDRDRGQMEILFTEATTGLEIDISRLGFGYSQILPIIVAAFSERGTLIFEAPEIHLNPSLHGILTDLFVEAANDGKQVLVETHSEHVIYRIQRRVAEGKITPENVAIYYVRRGEEGSVAERLTLTKEGEIPNWPDGFFEAEMEDIYGRILAGE
jgi:predicted ATPase